MNGPVANDTIAAIATAPGRGGIGIVRVSGPATREVAAALLGRVPAARRAELHAFADAGGEPIDEGLALFFPAPIRSLAKTYWNCTGMAARSSWTCCCSAC